MKRPKIAMVPTVHKNGQRVRGRLGNATKHAPSKSLAGLKLESSK
jgi:hypothetical protein